MVVIHWYRRIFQEHSELILTILHIGNRFRERAAAMGVKKLPTEAL